MFSSQPCGAVRTPQERLLNESRGQTLNERPIWLGALVQKTQGGRWGDSERQLEKEKWMKPRQKCADCNLRENEKWDVKERGCFLSFERWWRIQGEVGIGWSWIRYFNFPPLPEDKMSLTDTHISMQSRALFYTSLIKRARTFLSHLIKCRTKREQKVTCWVYVILNLLSIEVQPDMHTYSYAGECLTLF